MTQLIGFVMAVIGAILVMRWLSRRQAIITRTINEVSRMRQPPARKVETLEEGDDGVFRPSREQGSNPPGRDET